jgi:DNA repair exonuclease SbcCD ATPase subunit
MITMCNACNDTVRKDTYITHILKMHPEYFWDDMFKPFMNDETKVWDLRNRAQLKDAINVLELGSSYQIDDELYADFGSKQTFKNPVTANKHIQKHITKHQTAFCELIKQGLTVEKLLELFNWIVYRPVKIINDMPWCQSQIKEGLAKGMKELDDEKKVFMNELYHARAIAKRCNEIMETDEYKAYAKTREENQTLRENIRVLQSNVNTLTCDMNHYKEFYDASESRNQTNLAEEINGMTYYEKARKSYETKMKKHEEDCDKKIKQAREEADEANAKLEKREKKLKAEIKAYKQEIAMMKLRAKQSDSDSDSD